MTELHVGLTEIELTAGWRSLLMLGPEVICLQIARHSDGVCDGVAIGGDRFLTGTETIPDQSSRALVKESTLVSSKSHMWSRNSFQFTVFLLVVGSRPGILATLVVADPAQC